MYFRTICAALMPLLLCTGAAEAAKDGDPLDLARFDGDGNGICSRSDVDADELTAAAHALALHYKGLEIFARVHGGDFELSASERALFDQEVEQETVVYIDDITPQLGRDGCISVKDLTTFYQPKVSDPFSVGRFGPEQLSGGGTVSYGGLMLRQDHKDISVLSPKNARGAKGALFSYVHDFQSDDDIWAARGALIFPVTYTAPLGCSSEAAFLEEASFVPSISFDRSESAQTGNDTNALTFRGGASLVFCGGFGFDNHYLSVWATHATDFDFEAGVLAAEAEWRPSGGFLHLNDPRFVFDGALAYRVSAALNMKYGQVIDDGGRPELMGDETFFQVGPSIGLNLWLETDALDGLHAFSYWDYLYGAVGPNSDSQWLRVGIDYPFDSYRQFLLSLEYRRGELPILRTETEDLTLGLTIKF